MCGCLKDFLRGLKEPIVTYELWEEFVAAAETPEHNHDDGVTKLIHAVSRLPQANRDTLAFIILHLQRY